MDKNSLGERMKEFYEASSQTTLVGRMPVIIRLDGKAFHTFTRRMEKPFDSGLHELMCNTMLYLTQNIQTAVFGYTQSDEISLLLHPYKKLNTCPWYGNNVQKMTSVSAGWASTHFFTSYLKYRIIEDVKEDGGYCNLQDILDVFNNNKIEIFDSRVFNIPEAEVCNYFLWRQQDAERNSKQMLAQSLYSHKELDKKNSSDLQEMCFQKGHNWNDLDTWKKRGSAVFKMGKTIRIPIEGGMSIPKEHMYWYIDREIPIFSQDRNFIEQHLKVEQE